MGGAISLLIARKAPELVKGVVALDPVTINSPFLTWSRLAFRLWPNKPRMIQGALRRPHHFESHDAAFEFYRGKRAFSGIADKELMDYVIAAHAPKEQGVTLRFSGEWEACVYRSPPNLWSTLSKLAMPIHILGGNSSYVVTPSVAARLRGYDNLCVEMMDAGHLLPIEKPIETAAFVSRVIKMP
jgi:pimeloyl-ACP methyl ester carboxylesterase